MKHAANRATAPITLDIRRQPRLTATTRKLTVTIAALAFLAPAPQPLPAQQPITLEGLVVTANRWAEPAWTVASHATVIEGVELQRAGIEYVADALRRVPGMAVIRGGSFGAVTSVFLRGGESDYVQVLVDGVAVNEPGGAFDFGSLTTGSGALTDRNAHTYGDALTLNLNAGRRWTDAACGAVPTTTTSRRRAAAGWRRRGRQVPDRFS